MYELNFQLNVINVVEITLFLNVMNVIIFCSKLLKIELDFVIRNKKYHHLAKIRIVYSK